MPHSDIPLYYNQTSFTHWQNHLCQLRKAATYFHQLDIWQMFLEQLPIIGKNSFTRNILYIFLQSMIKPYMEKQMEIRFPSP